MAQSQKQEMVVAKSVGHLDKFLAKLKGEVKKSLPRHMNADRVCRLALTCFSSSPKLRECTMHSIAACIMQASQMGLEIGMNGQAYMIPYGKTATLVPGWKGLIDLVNRSAQASAWTGAVFEGDYFEWELGDSPFVRHRPAGESDPEKMIYAYAIGKVNGSDAKIIECWHNDRIIDHFKRHNKVGEKHYAHSNWEMYARKVVLLQVLKYLPQSIELSNAITAADQPIQPSEPVTLEPAGGSSFDAAIQAIEEEKATPEKPEKPDPEPESSDAPEPETMAEPDPEPSPKSKAKSTAGVLAELETEPPEMTLEFPDDPEYKKALDAFGKCRDAQDIVDVTGVIGSTGNILPELLEQMVKQARTRLGV
jgi:recombination protein RecT